MRRQLEFIDRLAARGQSHFTFDEARLALGVSASSAANTLRRLGNKGLVDRLVRGHYAIRPLGSLGTSTASEDLALAVGGAFEEYDHRIGYLSALSELGVLAHPVRTVYVACTKQVRFANVSRRPLRVVIEKPETVHLEAERVGHSWRSSLERGLFELALRMDLAGGVERFAEAVGNGAADAQARRIVKLAAAFGARGEAADRRLASLSHELGLALALEPIVERQQPVVRMDPRDPHVEWVDERFRVAWNRSVDELRSIVGN